MNVTGEAASASDGATAGQETVKAKAKASKRVSWANERRFYFWMTIALAATVLIGFSRSYYLRSLFPSFPRPSEPFYIVHGAVFTLWTITFVVQMAFIRAGKPMLHRALGAWGAGLAAIVVVFGIAASLIGAIRPTGFIDVPKPAAEFLLVPLVDMLNFAVLVAFAIVLRKDIQTHKRLMLIAMINMMDAPFARWPGINGAGDVVYFIFADLFIIPLVIWDLRSLGRLHSATLWGGGLYLLSQPIRLWLAETPAWLAAAHWMMGLTPRLIG